MRTSATLACTASAWDATGSSIEGAAGTNGTDGTNAAAEFTWSFHCSQAPGAASNSTCDVSTDSTATIAPGITVTPIAISAKGGCASDTYSVSVTNGNGQTQLASATWKAGTPATSTLFDPYTVGQGGGAATDEALAYDISTPAGALDSCGQLTVTFTFDETQSFS